MAPRKEIRPEEESAAVALLREIDQEVGLPAKVAPEEALFAVTCVLRQRLSRGEADHLVEALPPGVQHLIVGCNRRYAERPEVFGKAEFLARVASHLEVTAVEAERLTREIFRIVQRLLPEKEIHDVASQLPEDLRELWKPRGSASADAGAAELPLSKDAQLTEAVFTLVRASDVLPEHVDEKAAVAAVLCVLAQRLSGGEARDLFESLPAGLHPLISRCVLRRFEYAEPFHREEFYRRVAARLGVTPAHAEAITAAVFSAVVRVLPAHEVHDVASQLPSDLKEVWLGISAAAGVPAFAP